MRSRQDPRGHATKTVRDREAPGFKSRASDHFRIRNRRFSTLSAVSWTPPGHNFLRCNGRDSHHDPRRGVVPEVIDGRRRGTRIRLGALID
jgi:hypothetical protein